MARRRSEANMFLSSQEAANISGNEKKTPESVRSVPVKEKKETDPVKTGRTEKPERAKPGAVKQASEGARTASQASVSDILELLTSAREVRERGVAKSIYLNKDIHDRIESLSSQSGIPFSKVINMLLEAALRAPSE